MLPVQPERGICPGEPAGLVPAGTPAWITPELIAATLRVWQPYYRTPLTGDDAIAILCGVGRLVDVLAGG